jgi:hypothetical protein
MVIEQKIGKVIPFGYSSGADVESLMQDENTLLVDIRLKPYAGFYFKPTWDGTTLHKQYKERYIWLEDLGNEHYYDRKLPIKIKNMDNGLTCLKDELEKGRTLILLCACKYYHSCHRHVVVEALQEIMPEVQVVQPDANANPAATVKCLSVRPPYAQWLANPQLFKDADIPPKFIENRSRDFTYGYRGKLLIHASKTFEDDIHYWFSRFPKLATIMPATSDAYVKGAIVGIADLVDVITESKDDWFFGEYGFVLANAKPIEPIPYRGSLGLFNVPASVLKQEVLA